MKNFLEGIWAFFPFHLIFTHVKNNLTMLVYWAFLFGLINNSIGTGLGIPYLFLSPEYLDSTDPLAFLMLGAGVGGFIMAFHLYSYIQLGPHYSFLATLSRPFYKFSINNSIIPTVFIINLAVNIFIFQKEQENVGTIEILINIFALIGGAVFFRFFTMLYFIPTNKDLYKLTGKKFEESSESSNIQATLHKRESWYNPFLRRKDDNFYYFSGFFKLRKSRSTAHYDKVILNKVFSQNHVNASVFEILLLLSFFLIGLFGNYEIFQLPAGVSILMMLTIATMFVSAMYSWLKKWTLPVIIVGLLMINYISKVSDSFKYRSYAYGLSYKKEDLKDFRKSDFTIAKNDSIIQNDYNNYTKTLDNWKVKTERKKPKMVIVNVSGGGLRSTTWTFKVFQHLDSITQKDFSKQVQMITGASGGMVGASYYRDLIILEKDSLINSRLDKRYLSNISNDLLNRVSFSIPTNDLFLRLKKVEVNGNKYAIDRGYEFEQDLIKNLDGALDHPLSYYTEKEIQADIPTMLFTPTIVNDGRRMLIGAQHHGYLLASDKNDDIIGINPAIETIEFLKYFEDNNPEDIQLTSVLRANATFPYILPMVSMPTYPEMFLMDAGIRDNYGGKITSRYIMNLSKWIKENTSGVLLIKIRDKKKDLSEDEYSNFSFFNKMTTPFFNMYGNFPRVQDFNQDELFSALKGSLDFPFDIVTYNLQEASTDKIALSWHLTTKEKEKINMAINSKGNKEATKQVLQILGFSSKK